ncbi:uncharacterized protein B0T15DRAFT_558912 [Chaetomium strumarium]|uniref:Uncharacterized protein n=1 Tax=Chaetomium strumarium TaxID=1170767 RepID=A0AAJ0M0V2_9PEZI|nr:hypothetical protein B0T15DRAFT_558912 [Chaetomium strumarium]
MSAFNKASVPSFAPVGKALAGLGLIAYGSFVYRLFRVRTLVRSVAEKHGIQSPQHHRLHFLDVLIAQLKVFMLAGYDTIAATLTFAYHLLYSHPDILAKVRPEHSVVFGHDPSLARGLIAQSPQLLHQLPYTTAVLKETILNI